MDRLKSFLRQVMTIHVRNHAFQAEPIDIWWVIEIEYGCTKNYIAIFKEEYDMKPIKGTPMFMRKLAKLAVPTLCAVLFICANTNSCCMIYQPQAPEELERFGKFR